MAKGDDIKELNESQVWLKIIIRSGVLKEKRIQDLKKECLELSRIINASIKTVTSRNNR